MKRILYKTICIALVSIHILTISLHDVSFADSSGTQTTIQSSPSVESTQQSSQTASVSEQPQSESGNAKTNYVKPTRLNSPEEGSSSQASNSFGFNLGALRSFQSDPFTGKATFSIPISVPAGRNGIQPNITLNYSSGAGNGILGLGWSLELGSIERSTKKGAPKYDSTDTFVFNSGGSNSELVSIGNNEYRANLEGAFMKFIFDGSYWLAIDKSGTKYYFGQNSANQIFDGSRIFKWALEKVIDINDNYLVVIYYKNDNQLYPYRIYYTVNENKPLYRTYNEIWFSWDDRKDGVLSYRAGFRIFTGKKLDSIYISFAHFYAYDIILDFSNMAGRDIFTKYSFGYSFTDSFQSLLTSITQIGSDLKTSLPPITFDYQRSNPGWTLASDKFPGKGIFSGVTTVVDVNNDGLPDITDKNSGKFYLGKSDGSWQETIDWSHWKLPSTNVDTFVDLENFRFADLNGDGWVDIIYHQHGDTRGPQPAYIGINNKKNGWDYDEVLSKKFPCDAYFVNNHDFLKASESMGYVLADVNGDSLVDIIRASPSGHEFYLNSGSSGWIRDATYDTPTETDFTDGSTQLGDINADGLSDLVIATKNGNPKGNIKETFLSTGAGWFRDTALRPNEWYMDFSDNSTKLADINSDGLVDIVLTDSVFLNIRGDWTIWRKDQNYMIPEGNNDYPPHLGTKLIDTQGKFLPDLVINRMEYDGGSHLVSKVYRNKNKMPSDYLTKISNGIGGEVQITYKPSTQFDNTGGDDICDLPFPVYVVDTVTNHDTVNPNNPDITTRYEYKDGLFDFSEREFRGFGDVKTIDSEGNYSESYFKQDSIFKGRPYKQEVKYKDGKLYSRTENTWKSIQPYLGVNFAYLERTDNYLYEGDIDYKKRTGSSFEYDSYGNPSKVISEGETDKTGDEKTQVTEYTYNTQDWIVSTPKRTYLIDQNQNKVSEEWFYYDDAASIDSAPVKGLLTQDEVLIFNPITQTNYTTATKYSYDAHGNLVQVIGPEGRITTTEYDSFLQTYPIKLTNALGQRIETVYYGISNYPNVTADSFEGYGLFGQVKYTKDPNNQKTYNVYDTLGRLTKVIGPLDTEDYPGVIYEYDLTTRPIKMTKKVKADYASPPNYLITYSFYDGLGRLIESKSPAEADPQTRQPRQIISGISKIDAKGQLKEKYLPYYLLSTTYNPEEYVPLTFDTPYTTFNYDFLGRLTQAANPDQTSSKITYSDWSRTITDENSHYKTEYYDVYGRVVKIEEHNGSQTYTTTYEYDAQGNLIKVTDNQNNITQIWYDSLGRKIKMDDPDMGEWKYEYDKAGNLKKQTDAKGQELSFQYDSLNRLTTKEGFAVNSVNASDSVNVANSNNYIVDFYTKLLLNFDSFEDLSLGHKKLSLYGNTMVDTKQGKSNNTSLYFDGKTSYLTLEDSDDWSFGNQDFTIDFWVKFNDLEKAQMLLSQGEGYNNKWHIVKDWGPGNRLYFLFTYARTVEVRYSMLKNWPVSIGRWYHIAIVRTGKTAKLFIDGVSQALGTWAEFGDNDVGNVSAPLFIGGFDGTSNMLLNGWIDDLRVTKGKALWTSDFTPPQEETVPPVEGTILLATYDYDDLTKPNCIGRLSKVTDQSGSTEFFYDTLGREIKSIKTVDNSQYVVVRDYDTLGRLTKLTYPDNSIVQYEYNPQGIEKVYANNSTSYISNIDYSPTGQITNIQYANGTETKYDYDPKTLRLTNLVTQSPSGKIQELEYKFDNVGNIANLTDKVNTATQSFIYDDLNRLTQATGTYVSFSYDYDSIGNMLHKEGISLVYGKNGRLPHAVTQYADKLIDYDANGNMISKGPSSGEGAALTYDIENRLTKIEDQSLSPVSEVKSVTLTLKPGWNFISSPFILQDPKISSVFSAIAGKYDQVSRYNPETKQFEHYVGDPEFNQFDTFEYGRGYQICITTPTSLTFTITGSLAEGTKLIPLKTGANLVFYPKTVEAEVEAALASLKVGVDYSKVLYYDKSQNRFLEYSPAKKEFDTFKPGVAYYLYCLQDTNWKLDFPAFSTNFVYDGDGGRVKKAVGSSSTTYIGSLFEKDSTGKTTKHIFAGANRIASVSLRGAAEGSDEAISYYHSDHLGSSNVITDKDGNQIGLTEFTPYGSISKQSGSYDPKYKFNGKELESTGLYFYGARYYDQELGRFISADTIVQASYDPQSLNRYSYCRNNPINYIDPTGHWWFIGIIVGAILGGVSSAVNNQPVWQGALMGALGGALVAGGAALATEMGLSAGLGATIGGIVGGVASSAVNGGNIGVSALTGGLGAGIGYGLGSWASGWNSGSFWGGLGASAVAGGIAGGVGAELSGGSFGQGALMGAAYSSAGFLGSYGANSLDPRAVQARAYEREVKQMHDLNVKKNDMVKIETGGRPVAGTGASHRFISGFEMGPKQPGGGPITTTNTVNDLSSWRTFKNTQDAFGTRTANTVTTEVSFSGLVDAIDLYNGSWGGSQYSAFSYNSNYAVNTVIYAAGGNTPGAFWAPEFRSSTLYYSQNPNN
ncbi:MAG: SpvB/TcaC N-terminal domain-containing protein [Candidatus Omnitrophota bacterium]|nr:SpvB/TcaC N-terminal domain-containing protein [Candidatus Omnitrophota bacterium]